MKNIFFFVLLLSSFFWGAAYAQTASISGIITDTVEHQQLEKAVVAVLRAKDSVLVQFARSVKDGGFKLSQLPAGKYMLMVSYPGYADYGDAIELGENEKKELGQIMMTLKSRLLADVTVRTRIAAIRMKGDTVEYKADSFRVREGASVEEMLRKLPGLQVDKDGNITAHGEKIEKVLVDGEEFFGDDPTMATKNLQADAIDKVQVFDKKSDQATFTGIDDGQKTKTLNLTMKDDKKKGYFGKIETGSNGGNRWNNNVMANSFKSKRKFSVYGIMSSTGKTGLDWGEMEKYSGGNNLQYNDDGGFFVSFGGGDDFDNSQFNGRGLPKAWSTGAHYSNKFDSDKQNLNGSYRFNKLNTAGSNFINAQSILPGNVFYNREQSNFYSSKERNSLNGTYEWQIDSFTSIKVTASGYKGRQNSYNTVLAQTDDSTGSPLNTSNRLTNSAGENSSLKSNFILRKRFKKPGRTFSLSFDQQATNTDNMGILQSVNAYFSKTGTLVNTDLVDQQKINDVTNSGYYSRVAFTEPVAKNLFVEWSYGLRVSNSESKRLSYDKSLSGKYDALNDTFSNHYDFNVITNSGGMMWRYNNKKITLSAGSDIAGARFKQEDLLKDTLFQYNFTNLFPKAGFQYKFNSNSRLSLNYRGETRQPSIEQIQPIRDNTNTLNIAIGNPNLKQEFRHSIDYNYHGYKILQQRGFYSYGFISFVSNAISTSENTATSGDSIGKRTFQYININGNYNGSAGGGYNMKLKKWDMHFSLNADLSVNRLNNIVNNLLNVTDNNSYGAGFSLYKFKENKYDVNLYSSIRYNTSVSSIQPDRRTRYITSNHSFNLNITLPYKLELNNNIEASLRQRTSEFDRNGNVVLWNGYLGRKLMKNDKGMIRLQVNDILNQNIGYERIINSTIIREEAYDTIRRYFMLTFVWNFNKTPGAVSGAPKP